jgi:hypothetical protein
VKKNKQTRKLVNVGRHEANCTICAHEKRDEIEREYVAWKSPAAIAAEYALPDRASIYRHVQAFELGAKRARNIRAALERIIEKVGDAEVTASAGVAAIQAYAKINAAGQWVERSESVNLNELFERMSKAELETYARDGKLPGWFTQTVTATAMHSQESVND